jgi:hypothetical protein
LKVPGNIPPTDNLWGTGISSITPLYHWCVP